MTDKIIEFLGKLPAAISGDIGLYVALGLCAAVFLIVLAVGLGTQGALGKFRSLAAKAVKNPTAANVNACMQKMPVKVKKQYKRAMMTGVKPSDLVSVDAAVNTPYNKSALSVMSRVTLLGALTAMCIGVGITFALAQDAIEALTKSGVIIACSALVGGLFASVCAIVSSCSYKGAVKKYDALVDVLDAAAAAVSQGEQARQETKPVYGDYTAPEPETAEPVRESAEQDAYYVPDDGDVSAQSLGQEEDAVIEETPVYEQPVHVQSDFADEDIAPEETVISQPEPQPAFVMPEPEPQPVEQVVEREESPAPIREEPVKETEENNAAKAAAQKRLEELRAQREAQLKAQREAAAQARATAQANATMSASAENVIEQIEQIDRNGAPLPVMKEVAMLLQKERAKPENKTPEQQKKLNEALSKLLKAMSAANKR